MEAELDAVDKKLRDLEARLLKSPTKSFGLRLQHLRAENAQLKSSLQQYAACSDAIYSSIGRALAHDEQAMLAEERALSEENALLRARLLEEEQMAGAALQDDDDDFADSDHNEQQQERPVKAARKSKGRGKGKRKASEKSVTERNKARELRMYPLPADPVPVRRYPADFGEHYKGRFIRMRFNDHEDGRPL
jgi:hypothetical protein